MNEQPLSLEEVRTVFNEAKSGKAKGLYLCWNPSNNLTIITQVKILPSSSLDLGSLEAHGVESDWRPNGTEVAFAIALREHRHFIYDNYWMAYRHALRANKGRGK